MVRSRPDVLCQGRVVCRSRQQAAIDMEGTSSFIVELFLVCAFVCLACGQSCPSHKQTFAKFTVSSQRNQTGHWISQVRIDHDAGDNTVTTSPWTVEVEHNTAICNGVESVQLVATLTAPPLIAGPGYELYRGVGYYKLHSDPRTWHEARQICAQEGGHLAIINSEEESKVLQSIFAPLAAILKEKQEHVYVFIGFHDLYHEGQYLTIFDEPLNSTGFYRWTPGEPNNFNIDAGEDCGTMHPNGGLNDISCDEKRPFICEQELWLDPSADLTASLKCHKYFDSPRSSDISLGVSPEEEKN